MSVEESQVHAEPNAGKLLPEAEAETRSESPDFRFTLYICGATAKSQKAVVDARRLCDEYLPGHYTLEIIDLFHQTEMAHARDIFAIPTLVRELPLPIRRFTGDLSANERLVDQIASRNGPDQ